MGDVWITRDGRRVSPTPTRHIWSEPPESNKYGYWHSDAQYKKFVNRQGVERLIGRDLEPGECVRLRVTEMAGENGDE